MEPPCFDKYEYQNLQEAIRDNRCPMESFTDTKLRRWFLRRNASGMFLRNWNDKTGVETYIGVEGIK